MYSIKILRCHLNSNDIKKFMNFKRFWISWWILKFVITKTKSFKIYVLTKRFWTLKTLKNFFKICKPYIELNKFMKIWKNIDCLKTKLNTPRKVIIKLIIIIINFFTYNSGLELCSTNYGWQTAFFPWLVCHINVEHTLYTRRVSSTQMWRNMHTWVCASIWRVH